MSIESVNLRYVGGSSNKVYNIQLEKVGDLYEVNAQNGRYGGTLIPRKLMKAPNTLDKAKDAYESKLKEKLAEGYTADGTGTPFAGTDKAGEVSGLVPQLLNPIEENQLEKYLTDDDWMAEEKKDGHHIMVEVDPNGTVFGSNRKGLVIPISSVIEKDSKVLLPRGGVLDGEAIGDAYWVFDLLWRDGLEIQSRRAEERYDILNIQFATTLPKDKMRLVYAASNTQDKRMLLTNLRHRNAEGIVFKRKSAVYTPGRPNSGGDMVKFKFQASATVQVIAQNGNKRSVQILVNDPNHPQGWVSIGNVTIPSNYAIPEAGSFVEVEYLYAYPNGSLFIPIYKGLRMDKTEPDLYSSLKFKPEDSDIDS